MANTLTPVDFHGTPLYVTQVEGRPYVAIKPICEALSVDWSSQYRRVKRHPVMSTGMVVMAIPSDGGDQQSVCLPLDMLNGWLFGISAARVRNPEFRTRLVQYQAQVMRQRAAFMDVPSTVVVMTMVAEDEARSYTAPAPAKKAGDGCGSPMHGGTGRTDTAHLAAFLFRAPVYGGPDGRPARACRFGLRRARSSTPISGCRPTWKLVGSRHQARLEANHG